VIGRDGKWFGPEEAMDYVAGYVIFNDITARDIQRREMESGVFSFCKAIDTFCPLGPWIVTPDEIPDPHDLAMELRVNGEPRQVSHSSRMSVTIPEIISHYSALGYSAGDVLSTGDGLRRRGLFPDAASLYLKPGDVMEAEIEGIGVLRNPVISWQEGHGEPAPPRVAGELAARRREARARSRADGRARARRPRRPRARQRPLPDELWGMKGIRPPACFSAGSRVPRSSASSRRPMTLRATAWRRTPVLRGYDETDPRPPGCEPSTRREAAAGYGKDALELSLGTQATDRMVGEPTT
jgi:hypothetical protein